MVRRRRLLIAIQGVDGTGKSTQAAMLAERLSRLGLPAVAVWNRWKPWAVGLIRHTAAKLVGRRDSTRASEEAEDAIAQGVAKRPVVARCFTVVSWLEYLVQTRWRLLVSGRGSGVVVLDRYVADMVVDRTRRLHWSDQQIARQIGFAYRTGFPRPDLTIILDCSLAVVVARRPDENPQVLEERAALYRRVAAIIAAPIVDAGQPVERVAEDVWQIVAANKVVESSVMR